MHSRPGFRLARLVLAAGSAGLAGCASAGPDAAPRGPAHFGVVLASPGWLNASLETWRPEVSCTGGRAATRNRALRPDDPWLGTVALRRLLPGEYELGVGVALPNPLPASDSSPIASDRPTDLAVGVWLSLDF